MIQYPWFVNLIVLMYVVSPNISELQKMNRFKYSYFDSPNASPMAKFLENEKFFLHNNFTDKKAVQLYPWISRIIPTKYVDQPTRCTSACIKPKIFIAAARCVLGLTVGIASVVYDHEVLPIKAIVMADENKHSKQYFDDCALLVVNDDDYNGNWPSVPLFNKSNRTDSNFNWFEKVGYEHHSKQHRVLAFRARYPDQDSDFTPRFYEMECIVGVTFCHNLMSAEVQYPYYHVPCAAFCPVDQLLEFDCSKYQSYLKIEGALVYNFRENSILGVVSWGQYHAIDAGNLNNNGPLGIAIPNSESFFEILSCADLLAEHKDKVDRIEGYYQKLCDDYII